MTRDIGERHLARIYRILQQPGSPQHADWAAKRPTQAILIAHRRRHAGPDALDPKNGRQAASVPPIPISTNPLV